MKHIKIKLNGGNPVVLCSYCDKIIRSSTSGESLNPPLYPRELCDECSTKLLNECKTENYNLQEI